MTKGTKSYMFYAVITAYCLLSSGKRQECLDVLNDIKTEEPQDTNTAKYLVATYNMLGRYEDSTRILELVTAPG